MSAYYSKGENTRDLFLNYRISKSADFLDDLNNFDDMFSELLDAGNITSVEERRW